MNTIMDELTGKRMLEMQKRLVVMAQSLPGQAILSFVWEREARPSYATQSNARIKTVSGMRRVCEIHPAWGWILGSQVKLTGGGDWL